MVLKGLISTSLLWHIGDNKRMSKDIIFSKKDNYLLASISDVLITPDRAQEILSRISEECSKNDFNKVILDERTVERREVPPHEIMKLKDLIEKEGLERIHMAFWCQPHLINSDSEKLSIYTYTEEYIIKHFYEKEKAVAWLNLYDS